MNSSVEADIFWTWDIAPRKMNILAEKSDLVEIFFSYIQRNSIEFSIGRNFTTIPHFFTKTWCPKIIKLFYLIASASTFEFIWKKLVAHFVKSKMIILIFFGPNFWIDDFWYRTDQNILETIERRRDQEEHFDFMRVNFELHSDKQ